MMSCDAVGSKVSTLLARQLMTCSSAVPHACLLPPDGTCVAFIPPSFSFVSSLNITSGSVGDYNSKWGPEWSQNLCSVCDSTFTLSGALLGLYPGPGV